MKIYLAPMEGVIDPITREIFSQIGGFDQMCSEFIRVTDQLNPDKTFYKYSPELLKNSGKTQCNTPVFIQLLGGKPIPLGENAHKAMTLGAPGIDLNFGCPAKTVNRHDGGAKLLENPHRLFDIISEVKRQVSPSIPVSAKVRLGYLDKSLCLEIAQAVDEARAHHLIIHARTKKEGYKPPAHWEFIAQMKQVCKNTPVIANGDIWDLNDYIKCREVSGVEDVALGRGAFSNPFLAQEIKALHNQPAPKPLWNDFLNTTLKSFFYDCYRQVSPHYGLTRTKQWSKFLNRTWPEADLFFQSIKRIKEPEELSLFLENH